MNDKTYDVLKYIAQIVLPALGTLYFALSAIWGLPYGEQVIGTISAVDVFLGALLQISTATYTGDGQIIVDTSDPEKDNYTLAIPDYSSAIAGKKQIVLGVIKGKTE